MTARYLAALSWKFFSEVKLCTKKFLDGKKKFRQGTNKLFVGPRKPIMDLITPSSSSSLAQTLVCVVTVIITLPRKGRDKTRSFPYWCANCHVCIIEDQELTLRELQWTDVTAYTLGHNLC